MWLMQHVGKHKSFLALLALLFILVLGVADYLTGSEIAFSIFYLLPISLVAWLIGWRLGILMSIAGAVTWLIADLLAGPVHSHPAIPYWNTAVRFGFFLIVTYVLSRLRASRERQEELTQFIVHDLRSPLGVVMTGLQTLQEVAGETIEATQQQLIQVCLVSCNRMLTLINSLLDLARLESGHMQLHLAEVSVHDLLESSLGQVTVWADRNRVTLARDVEASVQTVYTDSELAVRILVNLLSNAVKFSPPGGVVTVRVAPSAAAALTFSITDQGQGIPTEWADKVFDKFTQVEAYKSGAATVGSGLGLAFCRQAVESLGGRIWLESKVDQGTTIAFTLPRPAVAGL